jgi:hypothetical protein
MLIGACGRTHDDLIYIHVIGLLDGNGNRSGDGVRADRYPGKSRIPSRAPSSQMLSASSDSVTPGEITVTRMLSFSAARPRNRNDFSFDS